MSGGRGVIEVNEISGVGVVHTGLPITLAGLCLKFKLSKQSQVVIGWGYKSSRQVLMYR